MNKLASLAAIAVVGSATLATAPEPAEARYGLVPGAVLGSAAYYGYRPYRSYSYYSTPYYYSSPRWSWRRHHHRHW